MLLNILKIKKALITLLGNDYCENEVKVILYGSQKNGRDIDIMITQNNTFLSQAFVVGKLDIFSISYKKYEKLLKLLDPIVTEPILTGKLLFGDKKEWLKEKSNLLKQIPSNRNVNYFVNRCFEEFLSAVQILNQYKSQNSADILIWAFKNLSYSIAYASFAQYYNTPNKKVCPLNELIKEKNIIFPEFWDFRDKVKKGEELKNENVHYYLKKWGKMMINISIE